MASSFSFGFGGEDIEEDDLDNQADGIATAQSNNTVIEPTAIAPENHRLQDLVTRLPSKISYNVVEIESPRGKKLLLPRRELFDIRVQLMAEDDTVDATSGTSVLDNSDIRTNIYEGGFKSWECSFDLAQLLLDRGPRKDLDDLCRVNHVVELGCGTALPTLVLFHYAITQSLPLYFTLTDYNATVLQLVTIPNLILTYASTLSVSSEHSLPQTIPNPLPRLTAGGHGDLEISPGLIKSFLDTLSSSDLNLTFISGSWSPAPHFLSLIPTAPDMNTLVLASETIYSPTALASFTTALVGILKRVRLAKGMIAAKRVYFGVGGSVDAFKVECSEQGAVAAEIDNHGVDLGEGQGVRRCLVEVQML